MNIRYEMNLIIMMKSPSDFNPFTPYVGKKKDDSR